MTCEQYWMLFETVMLSIIGLLCLGVAFLVGAYVQKHKEIIK